MIIPWLRLPQRTQALGLTVIPLGWSPAAGNVAPSHPAGVSWTRVEIRLLAAVGKIPHKARS